MAIGRYYNPQRSAILGRFSRTNYNVGSTPLRRFDPRAVPALPPEIAPEATPEVPYEIDYNEPGGAPAGMPDYAADVPDNPIAPAYNPNFMPEIESMPDAPGYEGLDTDLDPDLGRGLGYGYGFDTGVLGGNAPRNDAAKSLTGNLAGLSAFNATGMAARNALGLDPTFATSLAFTGFDVGKGIATGEKPTGIGRNVVGTLGGIGGSLFAAPAGPIASLGGAYVGKRGAEWAYDEVFGPPEKTMPERTLSRRATFEVPEVPAYEPPTPMALGKTAKSAPGGGGMDTTLSSPYSGSGMGSFDVPSFAKNEKESKFSFDVPSFSTSLAESLEEDPGYFGGGGSWWSGMGAGMGSGDAWGDPSEGGHGAGPG